MSKRLDDLIHELWANEISRDLSFRRISYVAQHHYLAYCESKLKWIWINKRQFSFQNMTLKVSTLENVIFCLGLHILSLEYIDCFIIWPTCMFERNMELIVCKNTIIYAIIINVHKLFLLPFFLFFFFFFVFVLWTKEAAVLKTHHNLPSFSQQTDVYCTLIWPGRRVDYLVVNGQPNNIFRRPQ